MNILLLNQPLNNRGDESAHKAFVRKLCMSFPSAKISVFLINGLPDSIDQFNVKNDNVTYVNVGYDRGLFKALLLCAFCRNTNLLSLFSGMRVLARLIRSSDVVICAPGGICMGGFQDWFHVMFLYMARQIGKPIMYFGRSIGPFYETSWKDRLFRKRSYELLNYFSFTSLRDAVSLSIAKDVGCHAISTVDSAFLDSPIVDLPDDVKRQIGDNYMVFVPNELIWHYKYRNVRIETICNFYIAIIKLIIKNDPGIRIVMLPQLFNQGLADDMRFFGFIKDRSCEHSIVILDDSFGSDIQQTIIAGSEYVIGARYHSIVFALNNAKPFISLSYEHKMAGLLESLGCEDYVIDMERLFESEHLMQESLSGIERLIANRDRCNVVAPRDRAKNIVNDGYNKFENAVVKYSHLSI